MPALVRTLKGRVVQIHVDIQAESVLIPINGRMVPLHISTVKNVNKYEEGDYSYFRLNLITPGSAAMEKLLPV